MYILEINKIYYLLRNMSYQILFSKTPKTLLYIKYIYNIKNTQGISNLFDIIY